MAAPLPATKAQAPASPASLKPVAAPTIVRRTLPSGLHVILALKRDTPLVAVDLRVRGAGPATETTDNNGVAHFIEHLVFKGSVDQRPGDVDAAIEARGGELSARTTRDATQFATVVRASSWRAATAILAQMTLRPAFRAADMEAERAVILQETATAEAEPLRNGLSRLAASVFAPDSPYRLPLMGPEENIRRFTPGEVRAYWRAHYQPAQMTLTLVGDVNPADVWAAADTLFPAPQTAPTPIDAAVVAAPPVAPAVPPQHGRALVIPTPTPVAPSAAPPHAETKEETPPVNAVVTDAKPSDAPPARGTGEPPPAPTVPAARRDLVTVLIGFRGPSIARAPDDAALMEVLLPLLATGSGDSGALGAPLARNGTALSVTADFLPQRDGDGLFYIAVTGRRSEGPGSDAKRLGDAVVAELARVERDGFDDDAITRARQSALGARAYAEGAVETWASRLAVHDVWGASDYDDKLVARTNAATDDALRLAMRRYLAPQNRTVVVVGAPLSPAAAAPPLLGDATPSRDDTVGAP